MMKIRCKILNDLDEYILADVSVLYKMELPSFLGDLVKLFY